MTVGTVSSVTTGEGTACSGALTLASTSTKGFTMSGGIISGCIGINQQEGAKGTIKITGSSTKKRRLRVHIQE